MLVVALWCCMWGRGREGVMVPAPLSTRFHSLPPLPTIKLGPSGAGSQVGGLVHTPGPRGSLQRPLLWSWGSLPLPPQPQQVFSIRGLRLNFPALEPWVTRSALLPAICPGLSVHECGTAGCYPPLCLPCSPPLWVRPSRFICAQMRDHRVCYWSDCLPLSSHTPPVSFPPQQRESSPPLLPVWMNVYFFISLVSDFLAVRFSISSGCARRRSVSTYAAILVLPLFNFGRLYFSRNLSTLLRFSNFLAYSCS